MVYSSVLSDQKTCGYNSELSLNENGKFDIRSRQVQGVQRNYTGDPDLRSSYLYCTNSTHGYSFMGGSF